MHYYQVWVSGQQFHGHEPLTYQSTEELSAGNIVLVPLQKRKALGVVKQSASPPKFATKEIIRLVTSKPLPVQSLQLFQWLQTYYPAPDGVLLSLLLPAGLLQEQRTSDKEQSTKSKEPVKLPPLTPEQTQAVNDITASDAGTVLLHGDTGTGKTRVYLELIAAQIKKGKSAIVLTPEIGLTPQLEQELQAAFPGPGRSASF
jgi:primosomal protein N' (replication factor Y) (superfamily II helicase)